MDHSVFIAKFQKLPDALQQQVIDFVERMLSQTNKDNTTTPAGEDSLLPDVHDGIQWIVSNDKLLPVTPASEKPDIKAFATTQLIILDVRTGLIPFSTIVTKDTLSQKTKEEVDHSEAARRIQNEAVLLTIQDIGQRITDFLNKD